MKKIFYRLLDNAIELYNLKKATTDSAGFDLVAAIKKKNNTKAKVNSAYSNRFFNSTTKRF